MTTNVANTRKIDYGLISFDVHFIPRISEPMDLKFRFQTFKEVRKWGDLISPNSKIHPGDRANGLVELLKQSILEPEPDEFEKWFDELLEIDILAFVEAYGDAKERKQKK